MAATDASPDFAQHVAQFRLRRTWPQLLTMFFGGCVALTGIASVASHIVHTDEDLALPMVTAIALYVGGGAAFSWGGARFETLACSKWLAITLLSGSLFVVAAFVAGLLPFIADNVLARVFGPKDKTTLASLLVDKSDVESIIGSPAEDPAKVPSPARSSSVVWHGPLDASKRQSFLTVNVRQSASRAARVRSGSFKPPVTRVPDVEDGCVMARRETSSGVIVSVSAARLDWVVSIGVNGFLADDPLPALLRLSPPPWIGSVRAESRAARVSRFLRRRSGTVWAALTSFEIDGTFLRSLSARHTNVSSSPLPRSAIRPHRTLSPSPRPHFATRLSLAPPSPPHSPSARARSTEPTSHPTPPSRPGHRLQPLKTRLRRKERHRRIDDASQPTAPFPPSPSAAVPDPADPTSTRACGDGHDGNRPEAAARQASCGGRARLRLHRSSASACKIADGSFVPPGTTTLGTSITITETGPKCGWQPEHECTTTV